MKRGKCRRLDNGPIGPKPQRDAIYNVAENIREPHGNIAASCKTGGGIVDGDPYSITADAFNQLCPTAQHIFIRAVDEARAEKERGYSLPSYFAEEAREYRRRNPVRADLASDIPDFDDPLFEAKLHTASAPLNQRKALLVELWNSLGENDRLAFLRRVARPSELRAAAA